MNVVRFYRPTEPWGEFSNFFAAAIRLDDATWATSEHYFQAAKFPGTPQADRIRLAATPSEAKELGGDRTIPLRRDWMVARDDVMRTALTAKFTQHDDLRVMLLGTGDAVLVEHTDQDGYWGDGGDGSGVNRLGLLLMEVRAGLR